MHDIDMRITKLKIDKVRHLENIEIPIEDEEGKLKHLIITGKNGSGKTSLLDAPSN
ncbi:MAG: AAA family ATPase [Fretibacterium sp.]|nr:AAA family ATPase [Fretibacterium sp.]